MQITFTIPNEKVQKIYDALKPLGNLLVPEDNLTAKQLIKKRIKKWVIAKVYQHELKAAKTSAIAGLVEDETLVEI